MFDFNDRIIEIFRADKGHIDLADLGFDPVLVHTRETSTRTEQVTPMLSLRDGDDWLIAEGAQISPNGPAWIDNLRADPEVEVEATVAGRVRTFPAHAEEVSGSEYDAMLSRWAEISQSFADDQGRARHPDGRNLSLFRLTRIGAAAQTSSAQAQARLAPDDPARDISIRRPNTDESLSHYGVVGDNYTMVLSRADTAGRYALIDMYVPSDGGPPPHRHDFEEMFYVLEGQIDVTFRGETTAVRAGEVVNIPARAPHNFHNSTDFDARMLCMVSPPGLDEYFTQWGKPLPTRTAPPDLSENEAEQSLAQAVELGPSYAIENLPPT